MMTRTKQPERYPLPLGSKKQSCKQCGNKLFKLWDNGKDVQFRCGKCKNLMIGFKRKEVDENAKEKEGAQNDTKLGSSKSRSDSDHDKHLRSGHPIE